MNKKTYYYLGGLLFLIIVVGILILFLANKNKQSTATSAITTGNTTTASGTTAVSGSSTQVSATGAPIKVSDGQVVSPIFSFDDKQIWYFTADGRLFKQDLGTGLKQEYLLPKQLTVSNVIWPSAGNDFIVETDSNGNKTFNYYDGKTKAYITYPPAIKEVDFLSDGAHVIYQWNNGNGTTSISTANSDLSSHVTIGTINDTDDIIKASPNSNKAFAYKASSLSDGKLYYIDLDGKAIHTIATGAYNKAIWSPDGDHFVFTKLGANGDTKSTELWLGDFTGSDQALGIDTPVSKITFDASGQNMYYAVTGSQSSTGDKLWSMSIANLAKKQFFVSGSGQSVIHVSNPLVSSDDTAFYFVNADGYLYSVSTGK